MANPCGKKPAASCRAKLTAWLETHFNSGYALFYNGAHCGASAPDHFHFQAAPQQNIPLIRQWNRLMEKARKTDQDTLSDGSCCTSYENSGGMSARFRPSLLTGDMKQVPSSWNDTSEASASIPAKMNPATTCLPGKMPGWDLSPSIFPETGTVLPATQRQEPSNCWYARRGTRYGRTDRHTKKRRF